MTSKNTHDGSLNQLVVSSIYQVTHDAGWDPYNLYDLAHASPVESAVSRYRTTYHEHIMDSRLAATAASFIS